MRSPNYFSPGNMFFILFLGLAVGTVTFKVLLNSDNSIIPKNFPTNRAIGATGLVYVVIYSIWASREAKKDELEYRKKLQTSLEILEDLKKKDK